MIIWGKTSKLIGTQTKQMICSHCGHNEVTACTTQTFFTLFFVPTFPLSKSLTYLCPNCLTQYQPEGINLGANAIADEKTRTPFWGFSGLAIIAVLVSLGAAIEHTENKDTAEFVKNPIVGDVMIFKMENEKETPYAFMKIKKIEDENITVIISKHMFSNKKAAINKSKNKKEDAYDEPDVEFAKETFKNFEIVNVIRKSN